MKHDFSELFFADGVPDSFVTEVMVLAEGAFKVAVGKKNGTRALFSG
jgi:hypothetical protein